MTGNQLDFWAN